MNSKTENRSFRRLPKDPALWTIHQRRYARSIVLASLYRPKKNDDREAVRKSLAVHVAYKIERDIGSATDADKKLLDTINSRLLARKEAISHAPSAKSIIDTFVLSLAQQAKSGHMRDLYTAAAVVKVLYRMHITDSERLSPSIKKARVFIPEMMAGAPWIQSDDRRVFQAWLKFQFMAPLVGALSTIVPPERNKSFGRGHLVVLRESIPQLMSNALHLYQCLIGPYGHKRGPIVHESKLWKLPNLVGLPPACLGWPPLSEAEIKKFKYYWSTKAIKS